MKKIFLTVLLNMSLCTLIYAQQATRLDSVFNLLKMIKLNYENSQSLSFKISYTESPADDADRILDSLSGYMQVSNGQYHWDIGNTEVIANKDRTIMLFKDDKIMYLTKAGNMVTDPDGAGNLDPLAKLDSSLLLTKGLLYSVTEKNNVITVGFDFPQNFIYKHIELNIDKKTGFLISTVFITKADMLQENSTSGSKAAETGNSYYRIEARYADYNKAIINNSVFDEKNYYIKTDKGFVTTSSYSDYKIFIGSPNL